MTRGAARRMVAGVGLLFACLYALSIGRGFYSSDGEVMFQATTALVERQSIALERDPGLPQIVPGRGDRWVSKYDPGLSLVMAPFYVVADWIAAINAAHRAHVAATSVLLVPALTGGLALAGVTWIALRIIPGTTPRTALWVALAAGLASPLWWYGRVLFAETVLACALAWSVALLVVRPERGGGMVRRALAAGIVASFGIMTRATFAVVFPALVWLAWYTARAQRESVRWALIAITLGLLPGPAALLGHNLLRFGDALQFGYAGEGFTTPVWEGVAGLLVSPGKGIAWHAPPLLLSVLLWPRLRRVAPGLAWFLVAAWGPAMLLFGTWWAWDGGWSWGPRFLVPLIPLSALPLVTLPDGTLWRAMLVVLIVAGVAVNLPAVLVDIVPHYAALAESAGDPAATIERAYWRPADALPVAAWERLLQGQTEPFGLFRLHTTGLPPVWSVGVPVLLVLGCMCGAWWVWRGAYADPPT